MGKASPKDRELKVPKQRRRSRSSSNKYLKPGALAQLRYSKASASRSPCTDLGKKRVVLSVAKKVNEVDLNKNDLMIETGVIEESFSMMSPEKFVFSPTSMGLDVANQGNLLQTPKTPCAKIYESESRLEALPMDLLVMLARQFHFNYTTPDRSRQEMLRTMTPLATEHWPFISKGDDKGYQMPSPNAPKAPRHGPRPPSRLKFTEMRQITAVLFQESSFPSRCMVRSVLTKPLCKNRALFYEDELCQAVAQNKLH
ncbi:hypothetical protein Ancab_026638 [Ancistrocladus abbreviatus]